MTQHTRGTYGPKIGGCHPKNVTNTRTVALLILVLVVLVSPPHQVRTAADTASEDNSCGHRRCWTYGDVALVHTYLHIRILGAELRYVRMWYIIRHTKTKRSRTRVHACTRHACTRADFFFGMYQLETRFARIKNSWVFNQVILRWVRRRCWVGILIFC